MKIFQWMTAAIRSLFNLKPRSTIYGFTSINCRTEILQVKRKHLRLLAEMRKVPLYSEPYMRLRDELNENLRLFDEIEARYFGNETVV